MKAPHPPQAPSSAWVETPKSSNVERWKYEGGTLSVQFHDGSQYDYADVPEALADGLRTASSTGSFLAQHIRGKFAHHKMVTAPR